MNKQLDLSVTAIIKVLQTTHKTEGARALCQDINGA